MCGLFGFTNYGNKLSSSELSQICNALARESEERGSHATGIAYINKGRLLTEKAAKPAYKMNFRLPTTIAVLGHTRHSTQGSEKRNVNNHPFTGYSNANKPFALAHNGIIDNDKTLRNKHKLPKTKIETDSYIAVQLIEQNGNLSFESLKNMAEQVQGSFSFSILDHVGNMYIVKGDSPISMLHFEDLGLYIYASTDAILWKTMINTVLFKHIQKAIVDSSKNVERVIVNCGEIVKIDTKGDITKSTFEYDELCSLGYSWWDFRSKQSKVMQYDDVHVAELKSIATQFGYDPDEIDALLDSGYSFEEIEELMYECDYTEDECGQLSYQLSGK